MCSFKYYAKFYKKDEYYIGMGGGEEIAREEARESEIKKERKR